MMFNIDIHYKIQFKIHQTLVIKYLSTRSRNIWFYTDCRLLQCLRSEPSVPVLVERFRKTTNVFVPRG